MNINIDVITHKFVRLFQRLTLKLYKLGNQTDEPKKGEFEYECMVICKTLINKEDTELLMSPISKKRYIHSNDKQVFIIIEYRQITIVNHNYSYTIDMTIKSFDRLSHMFDNEVERRRQLMEEEIRSNVKHSLTNIYNNILNENI